jgi:putative Mg2+ transporter-C (MgtC) family protein
VPLDVDLSVRLVVAALLGALVGLEREIHGHPAGMRTHLLVSVGSALFTVISIHGFVGVLEPSVQAPVDPSRVAAQVVSGIGFLGAGAIIKDGFTVRGLTTAASLWATAAIGMAAASGDAVLAFVTTAIVLVSLWPLNLVADRLHGLVRQKAGIKIVAGSMDTVDEARAILEGMRLGIDALRTERVGEGVSADFQVQARGREVLAAAGRLGRLAGVSGVETSQQD